MWGLIKVLSYITLCIFVFSLFHLFVFSTFCLVHFLPFRLFGFSTFVFSTFHLLNFSSFRLPFTYTDAYLIFITGTMGGAHGEISVMWRNLPTWQMVRWSKSPQDMWKKSVMWRNIVYNVWCFVTFTLFCCRICFLWLTMFCREICLVAIHALLRGEKVSNKIVPVEKNDKYKAWHRGSNSPLYVWFHPLSPIRSTSSEEDLANILMQHPLQTAKIANGAGEGFSLECRAHWHTDNGQLRC